MLIIVIGYKDHHGAAECVYCGNCGVDAATAVTAAAGRYLRFGKIVNPLPIPVASSTAVPAVPQGVSPQVIPADKKAKKINP